MDKCLSQNSLHSSTEGGDLSRDFSGYRGQVWLFNILDVGFYQGRLLCSGLPPAVQFTPAISPPSVSALLLVINKVCTALCGSLCPSLFPFVFSVYITWSWLFSLSIYAVKFVNYIFTYSKWEILRCQCCGSRGTHMACSSIELMNQTWECSDCHVVGCTPGNCVFPHLCHRESDLFWGLLCES